MASFISSNAYYGYVAQPQSSSVLQQQSQQHVMEVDAPVPQLDERTRRKRAFADELANFVPRLKRFREGEYCCFRPEDHGLAQMYHQPQLLLSPAADFDMACQPTAGNIVKFQSKSSGQRYQDLEEMLLLTHGCSSYHHCWQSQLSHSNDIEEAEF